MDKKLEAAISNRFQVSGERIEVFISPDCTGAIVYSDPMPREGAETGIHSCECEEEDWPFNTTSAPKEFFEEGFELHFTHFPGIPTNIQLVRMRSWDFKSGEWK